MSVSLSNICTGSKAKQVCFHRWRARRGPGAACGSTGRPRGHRHPGPPWNFKAMERKPRLHMHVGRLGGGCGGHRGRLPGGCSLGAGPRGQAGSRYGAPNESLGQDSGGKKVLEEMKEQSRRSLCPCGVIPYLFCMTDRHKTIPKRHGVFDTLEVQRAGAQGVAVRLGAGLAGFVQGGTKDAHVPVLGNLRPGFGSFLLQSFKSVPVPRLERLARPPPTAPTWGYTSVEKYSVFRFSSAKEMGGCCR